MNIRAGINYTDNREKNRSRKSIVGSLGGKKN